VLVCVFCGPIQAQVRSCDWGATEHTSPDHGLSARPMCPGLLTSIKRLIELWNIVVAVTQCVRQAGRRGIPHRGAGLTARLEGQVVLITGAGSGIGAAIAATAAREGAQVVLGDLNAENARSVAAAIGERAISRALDVGEESSWASFVDYALSEHPRINGLVNCAGIATGHSLEETSGEEMAHVLAINTVGPFLGIKATVNELRRSKNGSIVNIASCAALAGLRSNIAYATSKFGIRGLTKALVHELGSYGIRINSVFPGYIDTPMSRPEWADYSVAGGQPARVALGRTGRPDEISGAVCFLLSAEATYCTGAEFVVDGGLTSVVPAREDSLLSSGRPTDNVGPCRSQ